MKTVVSILLLFATTMYVLPVKEFIKATHNICVADMDEDKEDTHKKEKTKEFFNFTTHFIFLKESYNCMHLHITAAMPVVLHNVETPPPDLV